MRAPHHFLFAESELLIPNCFNLLAECTPQLCAHMGFIGTEINYVPMSDLSEEEQRKHYPVLAIPTIPSTVLEAMIRDEPGLSVS